MFHGRWLNSNIMPKSSVHVLHQSRLVTSLYNRMCAVHFSVNHVVEDCKIESFPQATLLSYPLFSTLMTFLNTHQKSSTLLIPSLSTGATLSSMATPMGVQQSKERDTAPRRSVRYVRIVSVEHSWILKKFVQSCI